ncbi:MAG: outer membrane protein assembly factor BamA [Sulfurovum sp.]|nr:outer membrane protein assembly factor BamA [Sulfurovum sp.]
MIKKILLSWTLISSFLLAQKIIQIKFEGLSHLSYRAALEVAGLQVGDEISIKKVNKAIVNFYNQGYFEDVWVDRENKKLIFHFKEKVAIANVEIEGVGSEDEANKLLQSIGLKKGDLYDERRIKKAKKLLSKQLQSMGNYDSVIEVTKASVGDHAVSLVFSVNMGEKIKIKQINFIGAKALNGSELEHQLANKEEDFLGWIPFRNNGEAHVDQLEYDAYRLKETYMKHGYIDAEVSKPLMRVDYSNYTATIDYRIKEGLQYRIGEVGISKNIPEVDTQKLLSEFKSKQGKIFNVNYMRKDMEMIKNTVGNLGYAYAKISPQMRKDEVKKVIDLQYIVQLGKKVRVRDVLISGNNRTKDRVIRRCIYLAPGDFFSTIDLKDSKNALGRTGFFKNVDIQSQRISEDEVDLLVKVKETSTGTISLGGGYGSYEKLMLNTSVSEKNLFGTGITGNFVFDVSKISKSYNLSFVNPKVWDSMYNLGMTLYKREREYRDFNNTEDALWMEDTLGASLRIGRQFYRHIHASIGAGYTDNQSEYNDNTDKSSYLTRFLYDDKYTKVSSFVSLSWDNTDDYYVPREGYIGSINVELASINGLDYNTTIYPKGYGNFVKIDTKFGIYYGMEDWIDYDLILRFKARGTYIQKDDDTKKLPIAERVFMGGVGSVRGYKPYSISPSMDTAKDNKNNRIGGTYRTSATVEASIPFSEAAKMRLAFFYDIGMIGSSDKRYFDSDTKMVKVKRFDNIIRSSTGVAIEWQSGFGPITLVFGYALDNKPSDETSGFEFSLGTKF